MRIDYFCQLALRLAPIYSDSLGHSVQKREKERKREREKEKRKQRSKETVKEILCRALLRILCDLFSSWSSSEVKKNVYVNKRLERNRRENV